MARTKRRPASSNEQTAPDSVPIVFYIDGYHGGIKGHMPPGAMRYILEGLRLQPDWNISLELEPISWTALRRRDPQTYDELRRFLTDPATRHRIEVVSSTYAQPYCWTINGESNIRHFEHGLRIHREHFPGVPVDTYAVQEPCFTRCLPQILRSFGFVRASLKNNTVFFGCVAGHDADIVNWVGPDGTSIPAIPRYTFDHRVEMWDLRSGYSTEDYAREAVARGIAHPTGYFFQDCGWPAHPWHPEAHTRRVTIREFFAMLGSQSMPDWHVEQDDFQFYLPWGEKTTHQMAFYIRSAENRVLIAEKMAALAAVWRGRSWPADTLREAWEPLLLSQHHDSWACCTAPRPPWRRNWGWKAAAQTLAAEERCDEAIAVAADALCSERRAASKRSQPTSWVRVFNTTGQTRTQLVETIVTGGTGTGGFRVYDRRGHRIPCQVVVGRKYHFDDSINVARVLFPADVPSMGYDSYRIEGAAAQLPSEPADPGDTFAHTRKDGSIVVESDLYRLVLDPERGGAVTSLYAKALRKEFVDRKSPRKFNECRGHFMKVRKWVSTADAPAAVRILENGPLRVVVEIQGKFERHTFLQTLTINRGHRPIEFFVRFHFTEDTRIGDPVKVKDRRHSFVSSCLDDRWKLQAHFPAALKRQTLVKNSAFDVCRSRNADTFYRNFNEIKHTAIVNWVDIESHDGKHGLALFSDRTAGYAHGPDHPLSLILGWGGTGWGWWGECPLLGPQDSRYALVPHAGGWNTAGIWQESARWNEPCQIRHLDGIPPADDRVRSLLAISDPDVELSAVLVEGRDLLVRLFNARDETAKPTLLTSIRPRRVTEVELDGRLRRTLTSARRRDGWAFRLVMPPFGLRTLRLHDAVVARA